MKCPPDKALPCTAVLLVCGCVAGLAVAGLDLKRLEAAAEGN